MQCGDGCFYNGNEYTFSTNLDTFTEAQRTCRKNSGRLATRLTTDTYKRLSGCCRDQHSFWIGLQRHPESICPNKMMSYKWLNSNECMRSTPLRIVPQPINTGCQGVIVSIFPFNQNQIVANTRDCSHKERFICQIPRQKPTTTTNRLTTTLNKTSTTPSSVQTAAKQVQTTKPQKIVPTFDSSVNIAAIAGGIAGFLFLLFVIFLYLFYLRYKKNYPGRFHNKVTSFSSRTESNVSAVTTATTPIREDHLYQTVEDNNQESRRHTGASSYIANTSIHNEHTYSTADEQNATELNQYQAVGSPDPESGFTSTSLAGYETIPELSNTRAYDTVFEPDDEGNDAEEEHKINYTTLMTQTEESTDSLPDNTVQYTTVRALDAPVDVYSQVNKTKNNESQE